jgi:hypothetical protein
VLCQLSAAAGAAGAQTPGAKVALVTLFRGAAGAAAEA